MDGTDGWIKGMKSGLMMKRTNGDGWMKWVNEMDG
jgi:hypothetical protein